MNKKLFIGLIGLFILLFSSLAFAENLTLEIAGTSTHNNYFGSYDASNINKHAQSFIAKEDFLTYKLTNISIKNKDEVVFYSNAGIRNYNWTLHNDSSISDATLICSVSAIGNDFITRNDWGGKVAMDGVNQDCIIKNNTKYYLGVKCIDCENGDYARIGRTIGNSYTDGEDWLSFNGGAYAEVSDADLSVRIYTEGIGVFTPVTSSIDILFQNETGSYKTTFGEGENFFTEVNYTLSNGINVTNSTGSCNLTLYSVLDEIDTALVTPFTLCDNVACTYNNVADTFTPFDTVGALEDVVRVNVCHNKDSKKDLQIGYTCGVNSGNIVIPKGQIALCSAGNPTPRTQNLSSDCLAETSITLTLDNTAGKFNDGHNITKLEITRKFAEDFYPNLPYNFTSNLFYLDSEHEYYKHGSYPVEASCSYDSDSDLDKIFNESITIVNAPPVIIFDQVNSSLETLDIINNMVLSYADSGYTWVGGVVDDDLLGFNVTWYNSTNGIIQQNLTLLSTDMIYTPSSIFRDIENSYTLSVIASDINFTVAENITFNITDSLDPVCTGVSNRTWFTNVSTAFNIQCTDESLYSFL